MSKRFVSKLESTRPRALDEILRIEKPVNLKALLLPEGKGGDRLRSVEERKQRWSCGDVVA